MSSLAATLPVSLAPVSRLLPARAPATPASLALQEDVRLAEGCRRESPLALRQMVQRFEGEIYSLCVRLLGDRHEAEDVAQDVFLRIFRSLGSWDQTRPLRPWILGITVNRCRTYLAKRARRPKICENLHLQEARRNHQASLDELQREIGTALDELRAEYREVFVLFHEQGLPYELIAEAMERPVGTIKTWLHRSRLEVLERLRQRGMICEVGDDVS